MTFTRTRRYFIAAILLSGIFFTHRHAQAQAVPAPVSLVASPASPAPGEKVVVTAVTPSFDRFSAYFEWVVDGKPRSDLSGYGKNTIELTAGNVGSLRRIGVSVSRKNAGVGVGGGEAFLAIRVSDLVITYVAETLVPAWYRGKALPVSDGIVNVIAVPDVVIDGRRIPAERLVYRWSLDDDHSVLAGVGETVLRVHVSDFPGTSHEVRVRVEDEDGKIRKEAVFYIVPSTPRLAIYNATPLGGVEFRTTGMFSGGKGLYDFVAEPFFIPVSSRRALTWQWTIGGQVVTGTYDTPYVMTVDTSGYPSGMLPITASAAIPSNLSSSIANTLSFFLR